MRAEELKSPRRPPADLLGMTEGNGERKKARPSPEAAEGSGAEMEKEKAEANEAGRRETGSRSGMGREKKARPALLVRGPTRSSRVRRMNLLKKASPWKEMPDGAESEAAVKL